MMPFRPFHKSALIALLLFISGCSGADSSLKAARSSFPLNYLYRPTYESIGTLYAADPGLAIEYMERRCRSDEENLAYRLTLADMYKDRGRVNDAIRLWFEILALSRGGDAADARELPVYFIPIPPYQDEGMRPFGETIDNTLAYYHMGLVYFQNGLFEEASANFLEAAGTTDDPDRKADLINRAAVAIGSRKVEYTVSEKDNRAYRTVDGKRVEVDPMEFRKRERALYEVALNLPVTDGELREDIERNLAFVKGEIETYNGVPTEVEEVTETVTVAEAVAPAEPAAPPIEAARAPVLASTGVGPGEMSADRQTEALSLFKAKELEGAIGIWQELFAGFSPDAYMVEIELDCRTDSVYRTFGKIGKPENFFVIPKIYRDTPCYRLLLGPYESRDEARAGAESLKVRVPELQPWVRLVEIPSKNP